MIRRIVGRGQTGITLDCGHPVEVAAHSDKIVAQWCGKCALDHVASRVFAAGCAPNDFAQSVAEQMVETFRLR